MDVSHQRPGSFDLEAEITKLVLSPDWEEIYRDKSIPLLVFTNQKTGQMKALGDEEACRVALDGWNSAVNGVLRQGRQMNRAQRRKARRN